MQVRRLLRSIALAAVSLAVVGVLFVAYQRGQGDRSAAGTLAKESAASTSSAGALPPPSPPMSTSTPTPKATISFGPTDADVRGGDAANFIDYDPQGRPKLQFRFKDWAPIDARSNTYHVTQPIIRIRTKDGRLVEITADGGTIVAAGSGGSSGVNVKSGKLEGTVHVAVDRLTDQEREELTPEEQQSPDPDHYINLTMDTLAFDLEFARIETDGRFRIDAAEATIDGQGLLVRYNELDSRIEKLVVRQGGMVEVRGPSQLRIGMPGATPPAPANHAKAPPIAPKATPSPTPTPDADTDVPVVALEEKNARKPRPVDVYTAVITGNVHFAQFINGEAARQLDADELSVLFDFGQKQRTMAAKTIPGAKRSTPQDDEAESAQQPTSQQQPVVDERMRLTWTGPLTVQSERPTDQLPGADTHRRIHVTATGAPVVATEPDRRVECDRLVYQDETGTVRLFGADRPAVVSDGRLGRLEATRVELEPGSSHAVAYGPNGHLIASRAPDVASVSKSTGWSLQQTLSPSRQPAEQPLDIRFQDKAVAVFETKPAGDSPNPQRDEALQSDRTLRQAVFSGQVAMTNGDNRIQCESLTVDFETSADGRLQPTRADARGDVFVSQAGRYVSARDNVTVDFGTFEVNRPPFDLAKARLEAARRGQDPSTINWEKIRHEYEAKKEYRPGLDRIQASGNVEVRDPGQGVDINASSLDCTFADGRRLQSGIVTPRDGQRAYVALGDFSIAADSSIPFDLVRQQADVEGSGRMTFLTHKDLDGKDLKDPTLISIDWKKRMAFAGAKNQALFTGNVHVQSGHSTYDCASLRVDFKDLPKPPEPPPTPPDDTTDSQWWIFTPLAEGDEQTTQSNSLTLAAPTIGKEPTFIYATGSVVAVTAMLAPKTEKLESRARMSGQTMAVDLQTKKLQIEGAGTLLIEDYRAAVHPQAAQPAKRKSDRLTPFGRLAGNEPSQTFVQWQRGMDYRYDLNVARFSGDVTLKHLGGSKMIHASDIVGASASAAAAPGREASLSCDALVVSFVRAEGDDSRSGRMSGYDVDAFSATGGVHFEDSGISAIALQVTYNREENLLQILGTEDEPAQLFDQRTGYSTLRGPRFDWNRKTNRISAPRLAGSVR